jgi:hypothetical protein
MLGICNSKRNHQHILSLQQDSLHQLLASSSSGSGWQLLGRRYRL